MSLTIPCDPTISSSIGQYVIHASVSPALEGYIAYMSTYWEAHGAAAFGDRCYVSRDIVVGQSTWLSPDGVKHHHYASVRGEVSMAPL